MSQKLLIEAHRLAAYIEAEQAKAIVKCRRSFHRPTPPWHYIYDPLAATTLGDLIYRRMVPRRTP